MLKTVGGSVWSELKGNDSDKRLSVMDEGRVPDFFDHWMEEYISKVAPGRPGIGRRRQSMQTRPKPIKKTRVETGHDKGWRK